MNWINVKDRLPQDRQDVLLFCRSSGEYWHDVGWWKERERNFYHGMKVSNVTHWMPLPELPKP